MSDLKAHIIDFALYASAMDFLPVARDARGCVITDIRMPEIDGMQMVQRLKSMGVALPIIVMTGHGDIAMAVEAMKAGVMDFFEKPFDDEMIITAVRRAMEQSFEGESRESERTEIAQRVDSLSGREREVLSGLLVGKANKVIAHDLDISPRTVEIYRANVMTKMHANSLSELVRMALRIGAA